MTHFLTTLGACLSAIGFGLIAKWYILPKLLGIPRNTALLPIVFPHVFRYIGVWLLIGSVGPAFPAPISATAAYGEIIAALLALFTVFALRQDWPFSSILLWVFNVFGTLVLLNALIIGLLHIEHRLQPGAMFTLSVFYIPTLLASHLLIFQLLFKSHK
jgi:hypothetical protein